MILECRENYEDLVNISYIMAVMAILDLTCGENICEASLLWICIE